jgi:hypothetical protein
METIEDIVREMRKRFEPYAKSDSNDARYVAYLGYAEFADRIEAAHKREVVVAKMGTTTPTCDKSSQVGNAAAMYEALKAVVKVGYPHNFQHEAPHIRGYCYEITTAINKCFAALATPPRNCDIMSLNTARKEWFAKEILPRLDGDLPLGKEVPFEEWFVSQHEKGKSK